MVTTGFGRLNRMRLLSDLTPQARRQRIYQLHEMGLIKIARESSNGELYMHCPFHADQHPSASYNYIKNLFNCFVCGGLSGDEFLNKIISKAINGEINRFMKIKNFTYTVSEEDLMPFHEKFKQYRNISGVFLNNLGLRFVPKWNAIYIPFFIDGQLEGYQLRFLQDYVIVDGKPRKVSKYYTVMTQKLLYGYDWVERYEPLVLVEGVFDALQLYYHGIKAIAMLGSDLTPYQLSLLKGKRPHKVIIWTDEEPYTYKKKKELMKRLLQNGIRAIMYVALKNLDPDESGQQIFNRDYILIRELLKM